MADLPGIVPLVILVLAALAALTAEAFRRPGEDMPIGGLAMIGLVGALVSSVLLWGRDATSFGVVRADDFALFINVILAIVGILTVLVSPQELEQGGLPAGEYYTLVLFGLAGMMLMGSATDLLVVFLALEILSLAVYVLTGLSRTSMAGAEAAFKYFLLGAFSSAFFLYGIALTYAVTGTTRLERIASALARTDTDGPLVWFAFGLLLVGFAFKVSAVPFHMWTPDAYQGAPTVVAGFMSTGVKAAAFAALARVFLTGFEPVRDEWSQVFWVLAAATMVLGSILGVVQTNVKRMLAYSSIAHAGYLLVGIVPAGATASAAVLFYLLAYALTNLGAFGVVAALSTRGRPHDELGDFAGLWNRHPGLSAVMTVCLLSLGGFPPTVGFIAKWYIFAAAIAEGYYWLAVIGVLTSVVSVFFYLRIVVMMYMAAPAVDVQSGSRPSRSTLTALAVAVAGIVLLGLLPARILALAASSIATIF
jgi:NADH-quinone oxidoreductase subunit N